MKFLVVVFALVAAAQAARLAVVNTDSAVTIRSLNGQQVIIGKLTPFGVRDVELIPGWNAPSKLIQLKEWIPVDVLSQILRQYEGIVDEVAFRSLIQEVVIAVRQGQVNPVVLDVLQGLVLPSQVGGIWTRQNVAPWTLQGPQVIQQSLLSSILNGIHGNQQESLLEQQQLLKVVLGQLAQGQSWRQQQLVGGQTVYQPQQQVLNAALSQLTAGQQAGQVLQQLQGEEQVRTQVAKELISAAINGLISGQQQELSIPQRKLLANILGRLWSNAGWSQQQILGQQLQGDVLGGVINSLVNGQNGIRVIGNGVPVIVPRVVY